jgi:hypothetical protein
MVALRSRKLEVLFGDRLDAVPHANIVAFVNSGVMESYDLDFKATLYGAAADWQPTAHDPMPPEARTWPPNSTTTVLARSRPSLTAAGTTRS